MKKWLWSHTGTNLSDNCDQQLPCGPCPGICLSGARTPAQDSIGNGVAEPGKGIFGLTRIADDKFLMTFVHAFKHKFVKDGALYITQDFNLGPQAANMFNVAEIRLKQGIYPVTSQNETVVDAIVTE